MHWKWLPCLLAFAVTVVVVDDCPAPGGGPPSIQDEVGTIRNYVSKSDLIVVGKVREVLSQPVIAAMKPDGIYRYEYKVAVIAIDEVVLGPKNLKEIRLGFRVVNSPQHKKAEAAPGLEGCFMVSKHYEQDFYESIRTFKKDYPNYQRDLAQAKLAGKGLNDPLASLKSKVFEERLVTAAMLIDRYRGEFGILSGPYFRVSDLSGIGTGERPPATPVEVQVLNGLDFARFSGPKAPKEVPIDAAESKLILSTLAEADWTANRNSTLPSPSKMFGQLGIGANDGLQLPNGIGSFGGGLGFGTTSPENINAVKAWLKKNADTYRIKKVVGYEDAPLLTNPVKK